MRIRRPEKKDLKNSIQNTVKEQLIRFDFVRLKANSKSESVCDERNANNKRWLTFFGRIKNPF